MLGRIPAEGESFETETCRVEIVEAEPTRIHRLRFEALLEMLPDEGDGSRDMTPGEAAAEHRGEGDDKDDVRAAG